ncbi:MAG: hypothetical protein ACJ79H_11470 [Myxococcales bacterium]
MAARAHIPALVALAALAAAAPASAKVYVQWKPRASLFAGFNDNVLLDGSGADGFGQARPGIRLDLFGDHQFHVDVDCQAGIGRLLHPDKFALDGGAFATSEQCIAHYKDRWSTRTSSHVVLRSTYAQDPFAISGLGLLLRAGQTQVFSTRLSSEVDHAVSLRGQWRFGLDSEVLAFGANDPGNGAVFTPSIAYAYRTTPYDTIIVGAREQLFYSFGVTGSPGSGVASMPGGIQTEAHSLRLGWERRLRPWATLKASGGPVYVTGQNGGQLSPTAKLEIESITPSLAARLIVSHDLIIGAFRAGAIVGDLAEVATQVTVGSFIAGLRAGVYRNADLHTQFTAVGPAGYSGEVSLDYRIGREWTVGLAGLRDARLNDTDVGRQVDRDVVQLRLTWERFQPF